MSIVELTKGLSNIGTVPTGIYQNLIEFTEFYDFCRLQYS
jgi:hypothetical protein